MDFVTVLRSAVAQGCNDIHLVVDCPPLMRHNGDIKPIDASFPPLSAVETNAAIYAMLHEEQRSRFESTWDLDCLTEPSSRSGHPAGFVTAALDLPRSRAWSTL